MRRLSISRVEGVLAPYASGFRSWLTERGYRPPTVEDQVWLMAHLSRWLDEQRIEPAAFTDEAAERFQRARRERYSHLTGSRALRPLLGYLRGVGFVPEPLAPGTPAEAVITAYREYLLGERGLVEGSVVLRTRVARLFLGGLSEPIEAALVQLGPGDVTRVCRGAVRRRPSGEAWASTLVSGLRSLLVFLHVTGRVPVPLAAAVPSVANWRLSSLPRGLDREHVQRILKGCDRATAVGRRDYAILMLLSRLGLRACEIAALTLDDIDWRAGELTIHGKGGQTDRLSLPRDVGQALVASLRDPRRDGECRRCSCARSPLMERCR
jgi:integrase/recombinase XerD